MYSMDVNLENASQVEAELWCDGLRYSRRRRMSDGEAVALRERVIAAGRRYTLAKWAGRFAFILAILAVAVLVYNEAIARNQSAGLSELALASLIFIPGFVGAFQEIGVGYSKKSRWFFCLAAALLLFGFVVSGHLERHSWSYWLFGLGVLVIVFGGWGVLFLRWSDARRMAPVVESARKDADFMETIVFTGGQSEKSSESMEILPFSMLGYSVNGELVDTWDVHQIVSLNKSPEVTVDAPWHDGPGEAPEGASFAQRHLSQEEISEINTLCSKILKKSVGTFFCVAWFSAYGIQLIEAILHRTDGVGLTKLGWVCAGIIGICFSGKQLLDRHKLLQDVDQGLMIKVTNSDGSVAEFLPISGIEWRNNGMPSPWRTRWW